ncbi:MAG: N-acetyltransferase [Anaerolineaceae bacterium]|nr:N-acetyltransferase [Anaerolineaceae bacterium]
MAANIRFAKITDAEAIQAIYAPIVRDTVFCFETEVPGVEEIRRRIQSTMLKYPWLVCETNDKVVGYVYASANRPRAAYQWSVEVSAYVHTKVRRSGIAKGLYTSLFEMLRLLGYFNAYAGITLPNTGSVGLHENMGFKPIGVYKSVGYKLGAWHDVGWWQLVLKEYTPDPIVPLPLNSMQYSLATRAGLPLLKI